MEYEIERCTRHCTATGRELAPGEEFFSVVVEERTGLKRHDYATDAWAGPPEGAVGWWKTQVPTPETRAKLAPNDVMLQFFDQLETQPPRADMRYLLALLLVRRRVLRLEEEERDAEGRPIMIVYCPRRDATYKLPAAMPDETQINVLQEELARLLEGTG